jgi:hypothetical protein
MALQHPTFAAQIDRGQISIWQENRYAVDRAETMTAPRADQIRSGKVKRPPALRTAKQR